MAQKTFKSISSPFVGTEGVDSIVKHWAAQGIENVHMVTNGNFVRQKEFKQTIPTTLAAGQVTYDKFLADLPAEERSKHAFLVSGDSDACLVAHHGTTPEKIGMDQYERIGNIVMPLRLQFRDVAIDSLLYDGEKCDGVLQVVELEQLQEKAAQSGIKLLSTTKLGSYGLPGQANLTYAPLFENVLIAPFPNKTEEVNTYIARALQTEQDAGWQTLKNAQGAIVNLFDAPVCIDLGNDQVLKVEPEIGSHGKAYMDTDLPHTPQFKIEPDVSLEIPEA